MIGEVDKKIQEKSRSIAYFCKPRVLCHFADKIIDLFVSYTSVVYSPEVQCVLLNGSNDYGNT
jgi:hypothetical protein